MSVKLDNEVKKRIKHAISKAGGNEVFFKGIVDDYGMVWNIETLARGNKVSVPAILLDLDPGDVVIHNHPSGNLTPSRADLNIAAKLGQDGIGFIILDNDAEKNYVVVEPIQPSVEIKIDPQSIEEILGPKGSISRFLENFEYRQEQLTMSKAVVQGLNQSQHILVEAGTGTGKSLAYLIPGILWAVQNKKRIVISTNTINLQEQIIQKDIPFLKSVLAMDFKAVLVKGRSNYLCLRKLDNLETDDLLENLDEDILELKAIKEWGLKTRDGSRADLSFIPRENNWEQVCSEGDVCLKIHCNNYRECFFFKARRESASADILVVNHHLLFADISLRAKGMEGGVLPSYHSMVFDEAHNIEDTATQYFGYKINKYLSIKQLSRLFYTKSGKQRGFLHDLNYKVSSNKFVPAVIKQKLNDQIIMEFTPKITELIQHTHIFFDNIHSLLEGGTTKLRLTDEFLESESFKDIKTQSFQYIKKLSDFIDRLRGVQKDLEELPSQAFESLIPQTVEINAYIKRLETVVETLDYIFLNVSSEDVKWFEVSGSTRNRYITALSAPLDVADSLNENIYQQYGCVVMTSATMTTARSFSYIKKRVGLDRCQEKLKELILPPPFNYKEQVMLCVPTHLPEPTYKEFNTSILDTLQKTIEATGGRAFVLFTSFKMLIETYEELRPKLERQGINCFRQGEVQRHLLLQNFKSDITSVLFATSSFWEGVDVQGEALSNVILVKLPFSVPDEPLVEARQELIAKRGGNPFMEYQVPQAVLKFKQGFGRLIRSKTDKGVVVITDKRILTKHYGKIFLNSLPKCKEVAGDMDAVVEKIKEFI